MNSFSFLFEARDSSMQWWVKILFPIDDLITKLQELDNGLFTLLASLDFKRTSLQEKYHRFLILT